MHHQLMTALRGTSSYSVLALELPKFTIEDFRSIMNYVGMTFLREGLDFRTDNEKAASIRHAMAEIKRSKA
jgi:hypothetical protein